MGRNMNILLLTTAMGVVTSCSGGGETEGTEAGSTSVAETSATPETTTVATTAVASTTVVETVPATTTVGASNCVVEIQPGNDLTLLSNRHGVPVAVLLQENSARITDVDEIDAGDPLDICANGVDDVTGLPVQPAQTTTTAAPTTTVSG